MQHEEIKEKVFKVISSVMNIPVEEVNENSSPDTIASWDSMLQMNLILALEEEFEIRFSDEQVVDLLNAKLIILTLQEATN